MLKPHIQCVKVLKISEKSTCAECLPTNVDQTCTLVLGSICMLDWHAFPGPVMHRSMFQKLLGRRLVGSLQNLWDRLGENIRVVETCTVWGLNQIYPCTQLPLLDVHWLLALYWNIVIDTNQAQWAYSPGQILKPGKLSSHLVCTQGVL